MASRLRVGLTGGIASGKSTVAKRFCELGVPVLDADESARSVVAPGSLGLAAVIRCFGPTLLTESGGLDRQALRTLIFADAERRRELESLLHPLIRADMRSRVKAAIGPYVVLAIPLLVERGNLDGINRVLVVDVDESLQIERVLQRDGGTREQAQAILAAQASRAARLKAADDVLKNSGSVAELRHAVDQLHQRYLSLCESFSVRDGHLT